MDVSNGGEFMVAIADDVSAKWARSGVWVSKLEADACYYRSRESGWSGPEPPPRCHRRAGRLPHISPIAGCPIF